MAEALVANKHHHDLAVYLKGDGQLSLENQKGPSLLMAAYQRSGSMIRWLPNPAWMERLDAPNRRSPSGD